MSENPSIVAVSVKGETSGISKNQQSSITLLADQGIEDDIHQQRNEREVSLLRNEDLDELNKTRTGLGPLAPGQLGENITTRHLELQILMKGTKLRFFQDTASENTPVVTITGMRRAGPKIESYEKGLKEKCVSKDTDGKEVGSKLGVFGVVDVGGKIEEGMQIAVEQPTEDPKPLEFLN